MKTQKIDSFNGKYRFLSNFYPVKVKLDGVTYDSVEHAYQAAKTIDKEERAKFIGITAGQSKRLGRQLSLRRDWDSVKINIMRDLLIQKFEDEQLKIDLLDTGDAELIEGNTWDDTFWGVCNGVGTNWLGRLLMEIRSNLRLDLA